MGNHAHDNLRLRQKRRRQYDQRMAMKRMSAKTGTSAQSSTGERAGAAGKPKPTSSPTP